MRGVGPGFFGVVTRLDLKLYPHPKSILASTYIFPLSEVETVTANLDAIRKNNRVCDSVEPITVLMHHPQVPADAPPEQSKIVFFTAFAFEESEEKARAALKPFEQLPEGAKLAIKMEYQPFDFEGLYARYFSLNDPPGRCARYAVDNVLTDQGGKTLVALADHFKKAPAKDSHILAAFNLGVAPKRDSCFSWAADCYVGCYSIWDDEKDDPANFGWLMENLPIMDPFGAGHYVNEIEARGHPERYPQCFSPANWERLQQLRKQYDPDGVFHSYLGHN